MSRWAEVFADLGRATEDGDPTVNWVENPDTGTLWLHRNGAFLSVNRWEARLYDGHGKPVATSRGAYDIPHGAANDFFYRIWEATGFRAEHRDRVYEDLIAYLQRPKPEG